MKSLIRGCFFLLFLTLPIFSFAQVPPQLKQDLAPVEGAILMPIGDSWLVDIDAVRGVRQGDILALLLPGERIVDPITKDVIGLRTGVAGYLEVTRVMSGYSYVAIISDGLTLQQGDRVRRFEQVSALADVSVPAELVAQLKTELSHLQWVESLPAPETPALLFRMQDERLVVASREGATLSSYPYGTGLDFSPLMAVRSADTETTPRTGRSLLNRGVDSVLGTVGLDGLRGDRRLEAPGLARRASADGVWVSPPLGENPIGVAVADLTGDGGPEIAIALPNELRIMRLDDEQFTMVAQVTFPAGTNLLAMDALDLNQDGRHALYLTASVGTELRSQVVEYRNGRFQRVITMVNWFLRAVELPNEGFVLLGQRMSQGDDPFRSPVFRVERKGDRLQRGADLELPEGVNLFSVIPLTGLGADARFATITRGDSLQVVTAAGERLWTGGEHFGGSDTAFYNQPETEVNMPAPVTVQQRLLRLPSGEILTVQNQGPRVLERLRTFNESQLVAFDWDGSLLQERWRTPLQKGYIADFTVADVDGNGQLELLLVMRFQGKNLFQRGHSALVIYRLQQ